METRNPFVGVVVGWLGTIGTAVFQNLSLMLTLTCGVLSAVATVYAIAVNRRQLRKLDREADRAVALSCHLCRHGKLPDPCPLPPRDRPADCPHQELP